MSMVIKGVMPEASAWIAETPNGDKLLYGRFAFSDPAMRSAAPAFDGWERLTGIIPNSSGAAEERAAYCGTRLDGLDQHFVGPVDLTKKGLNVADVMRWGLATAADSNLAERVYPQYPDENVPVYDVGKVDSDGIGFVGNLSARRVHKYTVTDEAMPNNVVKFSPSEAGIPGNITVRIELFAPGLTTKTAMTAADKTRALAAMGLQIESTFFVTGSRPLGFLGQAGPDNNNFVLGWSYADPGNFYDQTTGQWKSPAPGQYPMRITCNGRTLASFTFDYT